MTDPATDYAQAAADLDHHLTDCPHCSTGHACRDGDDAAETEYRTWRQLNTTTTTNARRRAW